MDTIRPYLELLHFVTGGPLFDTAQVAVERNGVRIERKTSKADIEQLVQIVTVFAAVVNRMETFALYFTYKVEAEGIAYWSVGATFVRSVRRLLPLLVISAITKIMRI